MTPLRARARLLDHGKDNWGWLTISDTSSTFESSSGFRFSLARPGEVTVTTGRRWVTGAYVQLEDRRGHTFRLLVPEHFHRAVESVLDFEESRRQQTERKPFPFEPGERVFLFCSVRFRSATAKLAVTATRMLLRPEGSNCLVVAHESIKKVVSGFLFGRNRLTIRTTTDEEIRFELLSKGVQAKHVVELLNYPANPEWQPVHTHRG